MIDIETLNTLSKKNQIDSFSLLREILQVSFVEKFYKERKLKDTYFKGGTCLKLIYGSTRFSEDLDFTTKMSEKNIKNIISEVIVKLKDEYPGLSFKKLETLQGFSFKLYLSNEISHQPLTIKLDFSLRESVIDPVSSPIETNLPVVTTSIINHLSDKEILAEKIRAILHRDKGRDLYDMWFLLSRGIKIDIDFINKKLKYYNEKLDINLLVSKINSWDEKNIDKDLRKFLPLTQREIIPELKRLVASKIIIQV